MLGIILIVMFKWGLLMKEGMVIVWFVEEGIEIFVGMLIFEVEIDKIVNVVEVFDLGMFCCCVVNEGDFLLVKVLFGVLVGDDVSDVDIDDYIVSYVMLVVDEEDEDVGIVY